MGFADAAVALAVAAPFAMGLTAAATGSDDDPDPWFRFEDPAIQESSGVALAYGMVVTVNDSGDEARLFVVDPGSGRTVGVVRWPGPAVDIEALAPGGAGRVWVADIGDNAERRETVAVTRVNVGTGDQTDPGERYRLQYPGGPADAEALLAHPRTGQLVVVTKDPLGGRFFTAPERLERRTPNRLRPQGPAMALVTGGEFFPDGEHLVLRNYGRAQVYTWPGLEPVGRSIDLPSQEQGESIAVREDNSLVITSEGTRAPVLRVPLPAELAAEMGLEGASASEPADPTTGAEEPTDPPTPASREGQELPEEEPGPPDATPWLIGGGILVVVLLVLLRALRPR